MNIFTNLKRRDFVLLFLVVLLLVAAGPTNIFAKANCTILTKDLKLNDTNSNSGKQVSLLQDFLYSDGYLSSAATGRYGSLTVAAVKKFQIVNGISVTGSAGPLTRSAIVKVSCLIPVTNNTAVIQTPVVVVATSTNTTQVLASDFITAPKAGDQLAIGQVYPIQWSGSNDESSINITLEDSNGLKIGYVAASLAGTNNHFNWKAGNILLAGRQSGVAAPGNYRLVISNPSSGSSFVIKSRIFSINEIPLQISSLTPSVISVDRKTGLALYGDGFNSLTTIRIDGSYIITALPQYVSPDGKLMWSYLPTNLYPGLYQLSLFNDYTSADINATSTPSNYVTLQVI